MVVVVDTFLCWINLCDAAGGGYARLYEIKWMANTASGALLAENLTVWLAEEEWEEWAQKVGDSMKLIAWAK